MSTEFGGLRADPAFRESDAGPSARPAAERDADGLAWPEGMDVRFYADSSMTIPGQGARPESCGVYYPSEFCDECGEPTFGKSFCERRLCPDCWWRWSRNRAENITVRLGAARYAAEDAQDKRAVHTVASPPEGEIRTLTDVQQGFRDAYSLAKERGVRGGVCMFHGYRVTQAAKEEFREADPEGGIWKWIREDERDWRDLTYWSPHYHIVGMARDIEADRGEESDVWRFRRIRSLARFELTDRDGYEDMVRLSRYLMSHLTFESEGSKDSVRWFGELARGKFDPETELSEGSLSVIERTTAEIVGGVADVEGDGSGEPEEEPEPCEECGATSRSSIWDAPVALRDTEWCDRIGREQEARLRAAFEWAVGDRAPPPGLKNPRTEEHLEDAWRAVLEGW